MFNNPIAALREIADQAGFAYEKAWNTQHFGSKLVDFLNANSAQTPASKSEPNKSQKQHIRVDVEITEHEYMTFDCGDEMVGISSFAFNGDDSPGFIRITVDDKEIEFDEEALLDRSEYSDYEPFDMEEKWNSKDIVKFGYYDNLAGKTWEFDVENFDINKLSFYYECLLCKNGFVNNCTDPNGGWALGCRIDGGQAEYVRVPYADQGLNRIPDSVSDEQALLVGDVLATGFWAARISEIKPDDTVLIIGAGPTGICTLLCVMLKQPKRIIVCEKSPERACFVREHYPSVEVVAPEDCIATVRQKCERGGADVVLEVAGAENTFRLAWECARPNAIVTVVALYDKSQVLPLPEMYGKNLTFKTGGVDGCDCAEILSLIEAGKIDTTPLITHRYKLADIAEAYHLFENKLDGVIKVAVEP